jgi:hypothetical protein
MPQDAWPLHQLESAVTPAMIRQIEGLTSLDWSRELPSMSQIVVERDGHLVAWTGWGARSGGDVHQIGLLVHPDHKALAGDLLHHVLGQLPGGSECVARIREYQVEALDALLEAGFTVVAEDVLMVKHAGVEPARVAKRIRVARVPSIQAFRIQLGAIGHAHLASVTPSLSKEELS